MRPLRCLLILTVMLSAAASGADPDLHKLTVQLPTMADLFPTGPGSDIANSQCLICHSAGMVLRQPKRTHDQWKATIQKMRDAYGAPLPADQVEPLAVYLTAIQ